MAIDKVKIARSFSRAAINYDSVAHLQREVGATLLAALRTEAARFSGPKPLQLPSATQHIGMLVDLGCGTGYFSRHLQSLYPQATYIGVDIAEGMLNYADGRHRSRHQRLHWLCTDAEQLPFGMDTIDCFFANLSLQWCKNLTAVFAELMRSLTAGGRIGLSTLGPSTLWELRAAWRQVDDFTHVNEFYAVDYWVAAIESAGFQIRHHSAALKVLEYDRLTELTRELKTLGARNMNEDRPQALGGRRQIQRLHQAYEDFRTQGALPATYEVYYWLLRKPSTLN